MRAIDVVDGAHVEAGQVLVELDCEPLRKEIDVRAASLAAADAVYERVVNGPRPEKIAIGEAGVGVALARAEEARATLDRAHGRGGNSRAWGNEVQPAGVEGLVCFS